jgi:MoaA/NifB/PqqE/SkfB family radical SAM enzyme
MLSEIPAIILKNTEFTICRRFNKGMMPLHLVLQVTTRCNSNCMMCSMGRDNTGQDFDWDRLYQYFKNPFYAQIRWLTVTGGEPFMYNKLIFLLEFFFRELKQLKAVFISTNGFLPDTVYETIKNISQRISGNTVINVSVSLDGFPDIHNIVRGNGRAFEKAVNTIKKIQTIDSPCIKLQITTTIQKKNQASLRQWEDYWRSNNIPVTYNICHISSSYYNNVMNTAKICLNKNESRHEEQFFRGILFKDFLKAYYNYGCAKSLRNQRRFFACSAGYSSLYIDARGKIWPCFLLASHKDYHIGDIDNRDIQKRWYSTRVNSMREKIKYNKICKTCFCKFDYCEDVYLDFLRVGFFYGTYISQWASRDNLRLMGHKIHGT